MKTCTCVLFTQKVTLALLMHCFTGILGTFKPEVFTQHLSFDCFLLWAFKESSKEVAKILFFIFFFKVCVKRQERVHTQKYVTTKTNVNLTNLANLTNLTDQKR